MSEWTFINQGAVTVLPAYGKDVLLQLRHVYRTGDNKIVVGHRTSTDKHGEHYTETEDNYKVIAWQELPEPYRGFLPNE